MTTAHLPRLGHTLRDLLFARRFAALGTLDANGRVFVSMVPYAIDTATRRLVLHVSGLAAHTGHMQAEPRVSLLVTGIALFIGFVNLFEFERHYKKIIADQQGNYYRIIKMEYDFLAKHGLPLPRKHWLDRMKENFKISL